MPNPVKLFFFYHVLLHPLFFLYKRTEIKGNNWSCGGKICVIRITILSENEAVLTKIQTRAAANVKI